MVSDDDESRAARRQQLLFELLAEGMPWPLALEAVASTALDKEPRAQTHSVRQPEPEPEPEH